MNILMKILAVVVAVACQAIATRMVLDIVYGKFVGAIKEMDAKK